MTKFHSVLRTPQIYDLVARGVRLIIPADCRVRQSSTPPRVPEQDVDRGDT